MGSVLGVPDFWKVPHGRRGQSTCHPSLHVATASVKAPRNSHNSNPTIAGAISTQLGNIWLNHVLATEEQNMEPELPNDRMHDSHVGKCTGDHRFLEPAPSACLLRLRQNTKGQAVAAEGAELPFIGLQLNQAITPDTVVILFQAREACRDIKLLLA